MSKVVMKLINWNIRACSSDWTKQAIIPTIKEHSPDICVLTEVKTTAKSEITLCEGLAEMGFDVLTAPTVGDIDKKGVIIASKSHLEDLNLTGMKHWGRKFIACKTHGINVAAVYFPQGDARAAILKDLITATSDLIHEPSIILGDLNIGARGLDGFNSPKHTHGEYANGHDIFEKFSNSSEWTDVWRARNPDTIEGSWFSRTKDGTGNPFRIDHMFFSRPLAPKVKSIGYSHKERSKEFEGKGRTASDHALMWAHLELQRQ